MLQMCYGTNATNETAKQGPGPDMPSFVAHLDGCTMFMPVEQEPIIEVWIRDVTSMTHESMAGVYTISR